MARKRTLTAHGIIARSKYCDLDKWVIAVLCAAIDQQAALDPLVYNRLLEQVQIGEKLLDDQEASGPDA